MSEHGQVISFPVPGFVSHIIDEETGEVTPDMGGPQTCPNHERIEEDLIQNRVGIAKLDVAIFWMKVIAGSIIGGLCSFSVVLWAVFYPVVSNHTNELARHWANIEKNNTRLDHGEEYRRDMKIYQQGVENKLEAIRKLILDTHTHDGNGGRK